MTALVLSNFVMTELVSNRMIVSNRRKNPYKRNVQIISSGVTAMTFAEQIEVILDWATQRLSKQVCIANVHMLMEAHWEAEFNQILKGADIVTTDGMPLVILMRLLGARYQNRIAGLDLFTNLCQASSERGISVFLLGSDDATLQSIELRLSEDFPHLKIAGLKSLPFRALTSAEDQEIEQLVNESGAGLLFLSLGCPKQEKWIVQHRGRINATMLGIGAAFPVYAGIHKHAPSWMRNSSLEWLYRLLQEPKRLWRRYLSTIPPFLYLATLQVLAQKWLDLRSSFLKLIYEFRGT